MRVAVVETAAQGGLLHHAAQMADALAERDADVDLVVPRGNELEGRPDGPARRRPVPLAPSRPTDGPSARAAVLARRAVIALRLLVCWAHIAWEVRRGR